MCEFLSKARWDKAYEGKEEFLEEKEKAVFLKIKEGRFLVPTQTNGDQIAFAKAQQNGRNYLPIFTDWLEFSKAYSKKEWNASIMTIEEAQKVAKQDPLVINFTAEAMVLPKQVLVRMGVCN